MVIPIHIPIGIRRVASARGQALKLVTCEQCRERYAYVLDLEATGEDLDLLFLDGTESAERAKAQAERNLAQKSENCLLPVPCPNCGHYQEEMSRRMKDDASTNRIQIVGAAVASLSLIPLLLDIPYNWAITAVFAPLGVSLLVYGYKLSFSYDPNAGDPEPRKTTGRQNSVWGAQLAELLAKNPTGQAGSDENSGLR